AAPAAEAPTAAAQPTAAQPTVALPEVSREDTLIFGADLTDQISMDPAVAYEFGGIQVVGSVYQPLVTILPGDPTVKPLLAKSWDVKESGDGWTITFKLDEKAKFASGAPVTADDVVYSWGRIIDLNKSPAFLFTDFGVKKDSFKAVDPQTVELTLPKTTSPQVFLTVVANSVAAVVEKKIVEANAGSDFGSTWLNDHSAGSGPYVLVSWERSTQNVLDANPNYWGTAPALKRVIMRNISEQANLQSAIETGDADIVQDLGLEQAKALEGNADVQLVKANNTQLQYIGMNAKIPPFDKPEAREAIRYAINYDDLNTLLAGNGKIVQEIIPDGFLGYTGETPFKQDIEKAKQLLAKAGVADGTEIQFTVSTGIATGGLESATLAAKLQSDIEKTGLKVKIQQIQFSELLNLYRAQKLQMVMLSWGPDYPDPHTNANPFTNYEAKSIAWRNGFESPEIAKIALDASLAPDPAKRAALYKQMTERLFHEGPYAVLYQPTRTYGVRKNIKGFVYDAATVPNIFFWTISKS
ncbi:MAG TPA: ABC transporter substrate-binding protein, partial [Roseiflexaceae bacterium]|nr:ABC transporter substrate-binding protein [Roseiflexaceae bacterium]